MSRRTLLLILPMLLIILVPHLPFRNEGFQFASSSIEARSFDPDTSIIVPDNYTTIQAAINAANAGDTIFVRNGTYYECLTINKPLTIIGESNEGTIINGTSNGIVIYVSADNVTIKQLAITTTGPLDCIYLNMCRNNSLVNDRFYSWGYPITLQDSDENALLYNIFEGLSPTPPSQYLDYQYRSIDLYDSNDNVIVGNVQNTLADTALWLEGSHRNFVAENAFDDNFATAEYVYDSNDNTFVKNVIEGMGDGIALLNSNGTRIYHNTICVHTFLGIAYGPGVYVENSFETSWDAGYPSGGNYWPSYNGTDFYSGSYQNVTGSDGIADTPLVIDANDTDQYPLMQPFNLGANDLGVADIVTSKTVAGQGSAVSIDIEIVNYGVETETFNLTASANSTIVYTYNQTLPGTTLGTFAFAWNTTEFGMGNYSVIAYSLPVLGENDTSDNECGCDMKVTIPGDVDGNFKVDMSDIVALCEGFGSTLGSDGYYWHNPAGITDPISPNLDIDGNGRIDMGDIIIALYNFGQHYP